MKIEIGVTEATATGRIQMQFWLGRICQAEILLMALLVHVNHFCTFFDQQANG